jgi:hypothetical protein
MEAVMFGINESLGGIEAEADLAFSDPLHLIKCDRYRKLKSKFTASHVLLEEANIHIKDYEEIGIPTYVLDNSAARRMEDDLALKFFSTEYVSKAVNVNKPLLLALLPSAILKQAVFTPNISKQERYDLLMFGFSIVYIYYQTLKLNEIQYEKHSKKKLRLMTMFDTAFCCKYMATTFSICKILHTNDIVHLGALGDHWLEHFFGNVRRTAHYNHTAQQFEKHIVNSMVQSIVCSKYGIDKGDIRESDSGCIVHEEENVSTPLHTHMHRALDIIRSIYDIPYTEHFLHIDSISDPGTYEVQSILEDYNFQSTHTDVKTSLKAKITATGGLSDMKRTTSHFLIK